MYKTFLTVLFLCFTVLTATAQMEDVQITTTPVAGNIYMLEGQGGNIGATVGEDGILIIDDQFAPLSTKILNALAQISEEPVKFVINTHWHGDHTGGNEEFGKFATIIAHDNVRKTLSEDQFVEFLQSSFKAIPEEGLPTITFSQSLSVHFNGEEVRVIHFPAGHTNGDSVIFFTDSNVVHTGDLFFSGRFPYIDLANGGTVEGYMENIRQLLDIIADDAKIIPGHGPLSTKDDLRNYYLMLVETTSYIKDLIEEGASLEDIQMKGLDAKWADWGTGFISTDRWIELVWISFSQ